MANPFDFAEFMGGLSDIATVFSAEPAREPAREPEPTTLMARCQRAGMRWTPYEGTVPVPQLSKEDRARFERNTRLVKRGYRSACREWGYSLRKHPSRWARNTYAEEQRIGQFTIGGATFKAPRVAWTMAHGPIPPGLVIRHKCGNLACVRVEHLELVTTRTATWRAAGRHWAEEAVPLARRIMALPSRSVAGYACVKTTDVGRVLGRSEVTNAQALGEITRVARGWVTRESVIKMLLLRGAEDAGMLVLAALADQAQETAPH